jgi:hypothetical protein
MCRANQRAGRALLADLKRRTLLLAFPPPPIMPDYTLSTNLITLTARVRCIPGYRSRKLCEMNDLRAYADGIYGILRLIVIQMLLQQRWLTGGNGKEEQPALQPSLSVAVDCSIDLPFGLETRLAVNQIVHVKPSRRRPLEAAGRSRRSLRSPAPQGVECGAHTPERASDTRASPRKLPRPACRVPRPSPITAKLESLAQRPQRMYQSFHRPFLLHSA